MTINYFFGKKSNFIQSSSVLYNVIQENLNSIGHYNISGKYYSFLNKRNVNNLKNNIFFVLLKTFGKNYVLFLTQHENKNYCIFINKKNNVMNIISAKFSSDLFSGTLFDGEMVKTEKNKYIFLINDLIYFKGESLVTHSFNERHTLLESILKNKYKEDRELSMIKKEYFNINEIDDLVDRYTKYLSYKCAGLIFKNNENFSDNYLFSFPECRTDSKILKNGVTIDNQKVVISEEHIINENKNIKQHSKSVDNDSDLFGDIEDVNNNEEIITHTIKKETCNFLVNPTDMPDIYELYCYSSNNNIEKYALALVPNLEMSNQLKEELNFEHLQENVLTKIKKNKISYYECKYNKHFKKWVPYKKSNIMDNISLINQTQILLEAS